MKRSPAAALLCCALLAACATGDRSASAPRAQPGGVAVSSTAEGCALSPATAASGRVILTVWNDGPEVTEAVVLDAAGSLVSEVTDIAPGLSRDLVVRLAPGPHTVVCRPGLAGPGIAVELAVADSGEAGPVLEDRDEALEAASAHYTAYLRDQVGLLQAASAAFTAAYAAGDDDLARRLYPAARAPWERVEPVAQYFGDLAHAIDWREADLVAGEAWTGWHPMEEDLWGDAGLTPSERRALADRLTADLAEFARRVEDPGFSVEALRLGAIATALLDQAAVGAVEGREAPWSGADLRMLAAKIEGAQAVHEALRPLVEAVDPSLAEEVGRRLDEAWAALGAHGSPAHGFTAYGDLTPEQRRALARAVDALAGRVGLLGAAILA